jgi:hypothetical protein
MTPRDIVKAQWQASQRGALAIWTVYDRPKDHPEGYIARRFEAGAEIVATTDTIEGTLEEIRQTLERAGLVKLPRQPGDERPIVESWV